MKFNEKDRCTLNSYISVINGLSNYFGPGYEIVLHSLEDLEHSVIAIVNGDHTGRKVGHPITDLALKMLADIESNQSADYIAYSSFNKKGEPLKSTTIAIRGDNSRIIGLICINFYMNTPLYDIIESLTELKQDAMANGSEKFTDNTAELVAEAVARAQEQVLADHSIPSSLRNKAVIKRLYDQGIFNLKDAVIQVAEALDISKNTVYLHLRALKPCDKA